MNTQNLRRLDAIVRHGKTFGRVVDILLLALLLTALLLILTGHAHAGTFDFLKPSKAAAKINQIENALYFAAGIVAALAVIYVLRVACRFISAHWKLSLGLAGIAVCCIVLLGGCSPEKKKAVLRVQTGKGNAVEVSLPPNVDAQTLIALNTALANQQILSVEELQTESIMRERETNLSMLKAGLWALCFFGLLGTVITCVWLNIRRAER